MGQVMLSSRKGKETVLVGLEETSATLALRGGVIVDAISDNTSIEFIKITLTSAAQSAEAVDLGIAVFAPDAVARRTLIY